MVNGVIVKSTGAWYKVWLDQQIMVDARLRGKLRLDDDASKYTNPVAVGDRVALEPESSDGYTIIEVLPRTNYLIRKSSHKRGYHIHIIASNIDLACIVATVSQPRTAPGFIDRFLVTCESYDIEANIVFNKSDLLSENDKDKLNELIELYTKIGYKCFVTSAFKNEGIEPLKTTLMGKRTLFSGLSGVGKSSLLNLLAPEYSQKTATLSNYTQKGQHTTTFAEMFITNNNTFIIDTPGLKEFGLADIQPGELWGFFPEIKKFSADCKYNNCTHMHEPDCKVLEALDNGLIAPSRFDSYESMFLQRDTRGKIR